jgi:hypothetical protein
MVCENDKGLSGRDFQAESPVCPLCGTDASNPRDREYILEIETVHFDPPFHAKRGCGHAACNPAMKLGDVKFLTGEPAVVTCEPCRGTDAWAKAMGVLKVPQVAPQVDTIVDVESGSLKYDTTPLEKP